MPRLFTLEVPYWLVEPLICAVAAAVLLGVLVPLLYAIGHRDGRRKGLDKGLIVGYHRCIDHRSAALSEEEAVVRTAKVLAKERAALDKRIGVRTRAIVATRDED